MVEATQFHFANFLFASLSKWAYLYSFIFVFECGSNELKIYYFQFEKETDFTTHAHFSSHAFSITYMRNEFNDSKWFFFSFVISFTIAYSIIVLLKKFLTRTLRQKKNGEKSNCQSQWQIKRSAAHNEFISIATWCQSSS